MPVKWKIFYALNLILALPAFICLLVLIIRFFNTYHVTDYNIYFSLFCFSFLMITLNGFLNIYILQRFYPDKLLPVTVKNLNVISLIINILVSVGILIVLIIGATAEFGADYERRASDGKTILLILSIALIIQITILVMQGQLPGLLNRNNHEKIHSLIDSIGE